MNTTIKINSLVKELKIEIKQCNCSKQSLTDQVYEDFKKYEQSLEDDKSKIRNLYHYFANKHNLKE